MTRFLVDGEKLSHLNPKNMRQEYSPGHRDATGIGLPPPAAKTTPANQDLHVEDLGA